MPLSPDPQKIRAIAKFLDIIFPRVEHIANVLKYTDPSWIEVERLVKKFQKARVEVG
jgi:hypothetical protein